MSERRRTAFADILRAEPDPLLEGRATSEGEISERRTSPVVSPPAATRPMAAKRNKAISPDYTKLTAYIPRTLASAIKMSMALDQTADQSEYIERALIEWLRFKGRETVLSQVGVAL